MIETSALPRTDARPLDLPRFRNPFARVAARVRTAFTIDVDLAALGDDADAWIDQLTARVD